MRLCVKRHKGWPLFTLLLFDGLEHTVAGDTRILAIARHIGVLLGVEIRTRIVVSASERLTAPERGGDMLLTGGRVWSNQRRLLRQRRRRTLACECGMAALRANQTLPRLRRDIADQ